MGILLQGCIFTPVPPDPECIYDGNLCGGRQWPNFTGTWFEYYLRGISYLDCECYDYAINDLTKAINIKPEDQRSQITYGMHSIHYFPNRERGLAYYLLGDYRKALRDLKQSNKKEPSDKASFYIDKVRKNFSPGYFEKVTPGQPLHQPTIVLYPPLNKKNSIRIKDNNIFISGRIYDPDYICSISINEHPYFIKESIQLIEFQKKIQLKSGLNKINISVKNLFGKNMLKKLTVFVDNSGPDIVIYPGTSHNTIHGVLIDDSQIQSLTMNGRKVDLNTNNEFSFDIYPNIDIILLKALDNLGNITVAKYSKNKFSGINSSLLAQNFRSTDINDYSFYYKPKQNAFEQFLRIRLRGILNGETVYKKHIKFDGKILALRGISSLDIKVINSTKTEIFSKTKDLNIPCQQLYFSDDIVLSKGLNFVEINAKDTIGNIVKKTVEINYKQPSIYHLEHRLRLKVFPIDSCVWFNSSLKQNEITPTQNDDNQLSNSKKSLFTNQLLKEIIHTNRFQIIFPGNMENIIKINNSIHADTAKTIPAHALFIADSWENRHGIEIYARIVDVKTSKIYRTLDVYTDQKNMKSLTLLAVRLNKNLCHQLPLVIGTATIDKEKESLKVTFESKHDLLDRLVLIYSKKPEKRNPETNHSFGSECIILDREAQINYRLTNGTNAYEIRTPYLKNIIKDIEVITK